MRNSVIHMQEGTPGSYPALDWFRMVSAFLIIAIHTSPLADISGYADFVLTGIIGRVAVPYFFMVSGFFLFDGQHLQKSRLIHFIKKTGLLYLITILLYLPVNWYTGYLNTDKPIGFFLKDILINGTMYHLWYLPAVITGSILVYFALQHLSLKSVFLVSCFFYIVGLLGDSYYGITAKIPFLKGFYLCLFQFMDYTRNGFFLAPVFLVMGMMIRKKEKARRERKQGLLNIEKERLIYRFMVVIVLLTAEGTILRHFKLMRHDSMYIMLVPVMYILFSLLLTPRWKERRHYRDISLVIYIVHPWVIILVRGAVKIIGSTKWAVDNSIIHYLLVSVFSLLTGAAYYLITKAYKQGRGGIHGKGN